MTLVWDNFNRGGSEKLVMLAMADWCNDTGGSLHPSVSTVGKKANISESQARRILHKFIDEGYLTVIANQFGGDKGQTRHYKLNVLKLSTPSMGATPSTNATPSMGARLPLAPMRATPSMGATLTTIEPSIEPPYIPNNDFETFWLNYPRKKNKGTALKAWLKLKPRIDDVLFALSWQRESVDWQKNDGQFIPYPASYLNAHGWKDEEPTNNGVPF